MVCGGQRLSCRKLYENMIARLVPSLTVDLAQGVHPRVVMEILGHKDLSTTMRIYGHVVDRMKQEAAAKMDVLFGVATNSATKVCLPLQVN